MRLTDNIYFQKNILLGIQEYEPTKNTPIIVNNIILILR